MEANSESMWKHCPWIYERGFDSESGRKGLLFGFWTPWQVTRGLKVVRLIRLARLLRLAKKLGVAAAANPTEMVWVLIGSRWCRKMSRALSTKSDTTCAMSYPYCGLSSHPPLIDLIALLIVYVSIMGWMTVPPTACDWGFGRSPRDLLAVAAEDSEGSTNGWVKTWNSFLVFQYYLVISISIHIT